tara:strand:- start:283 stop:693 length:411 start_codon:yes stop_codon:yes gene_type:complete
MKRLLFSLILTIGFPAAVSATNYVECEAIRAVMSRTEIQKKEAISLAKSKFAKLKTREKYGTPTPEFLKKKGGACYLYGGETVTSTKYKECESFKKNVWKNFKGEGAQYVIEQIKPYIDIEDRASKDFTKRGCYYF